MSVVIIYLIHMTKDRRYIIHFTIRNGIILIFRLIYKILQNFI